MSKIIVDHSGQDPIFKYNVDDSYENNFEKWLRWTNREHRIYGEKEYTDEQGREIFKSIYGVV